MTGYDPSFLASGARLAQFEELAIGADLALNPTERAYLRDSVAERERQEAAEQARQDRELELARQSAAAQRSAASRLRYLVGALALFLVVAIGLSVFAFNRQAAALANLTRSDAQRLAAEANRLLVEHGNAEVIALLTVYSLRVQYTSQGDEALAGAVRRDLPRRLFNIHAAPLNAIALSPDGKQMLVGSQDGTTRLWDVQAGVEQRQFAGHSGESGVAFSPDGTMILSGGFDGSAFLYDARTGAELRQLHGPKLGLYTAAFSPDGAAVIMGDDAGGYCQLNDLRHVVVSSVA